MTRWFAFEAEVSLILESLQIPSVFEVLVWPKMDAYSKHFAAGLTTV
jgi:hypothetical protein